MTASRASSLYRKILRAHSRFLPDEMRALGDTYVKSEFRLHKAVTNESHLDSFFSGWTEYLEKMEQVARARESMAAGLSENRNGKIGGPPYSDLYSFGSELDQDTDLSDEQKLQLKKLREETSKLKK